MPELPSWLVLDNRLPIIVGVAVSALLLIFVVMRLVLRGKRTAQTPGLASTMALPPAPPEVEGFTIDFSRSSLNDWLRPPASRPAGTLVDAEYRLGAMDSARSKQQLAAVPGCKYRVDFTVAAVSDPTNGGRANFFVGPMFLDASGNIVGWWKEQKEIRVAEGARSGAVEVTAPAGASTVHISMHGSWEKQGIVPGNGIVAFSRLTLRKID